MPPKKEKKKTPKQIIAALEAEVASLKLERAAASLKSNDDSARLATTIETLKALLLSQQKEVDASRDAVEKELRLEISKLMAENERLKDAAGTARENAQGIVTLQGERIKLLKQVADAVASREAAEKAHAQHAHEMQSNINSLKARLETVFSDTLRTAVADEKKRCVYVCCVCWPPHQYHALDWRTQMMMVLVIP